ncbi:membrane glycosyltransferase [Noviherbaspirillum humi]|uniref:Glucans biosynthesis glucosyltransferase H n=2 Tax=Noviherbaspirillum humi TaxID=1688639 RepID=A0A239KKE9_9BURK|nr:membrane glycosyltransferase [Noviherbaspirillum humi]
MNAQPASSEKVVQQARLMCRRYLDRLPLAQAQRAEFEARLHGAEPEQALADLHNLLAGGDATPSNPAYGSIMKRLQLAYGRRAPDRREPGNVRHLDIERRKQARMQFTPPINRSSMVPVPWGTLNPLQRWMEQRRRSKTDWVPRKPQPQRQAWPADAPVTADRERDDAPHPRGQWRLIGTIRRFMLLALMLAQTVVATWFMSQVLPYQGKAFSEMALLALFALLFCWVSAGFWTALAGFLVLARGKDRFAIASHVDPAAAIPPEARTAIVMPICNEDVARVMAGLRATYESLARTGDLKRFDFFLLSDSSGGDVRAAELSAWAELCKAVDGFGRIFYRHRKRRVKRKSGNIDDFCRRWGSDYRYMIVLDADSVMSGDCLTRLVRLMEAHPGAGIIQTLPVAAGRDTLYARIQQFASRVYGPLFTAGLHYWQLGESHYWGHNAILRLEPLMRHCALSPLPGRGSLAGEILSHDFVEAALMRRAGWGVWIAYDLPGSYEEMPPNLLDELKRDRRWCHGNLMNFRLLTARGMHPVHRAVFITGVMAYLSAPLWALFLALSTGMLALHTLTVPEYFVEPRQLFPIWPQWHPEKALALFSATATLLFLPKLLSVLLICARGAREFGGALRLCAGMLLEMLFSMLLAPVRMLFHTRFVIGAFLGWALHWKSPPRADSETGWREALEKHGWMMLLGLAWGAGVYWLNPSFVWWLLPIAGGLFLSAPVSVLSSRVSLGRWFRRGRLFTIPEELTPPPELQASAAHHAQTPEPPGFSGAVADPVLNALACAAGHAADPARAQRGFARALALGGPDELDDQHKNALLDDPVTLSQLHLHAWATPQTLARWEADKPGPASCQAG